MTSKTDLIALYRGHLAQYGPGPRAVQLADAATQQARFAVLLDVDPNMSSVLDFGSGMADFYHFLRAKGSKARYLGLDVVPEFVALGQSATAQDSNADVMLSDIEEDTLPEGYDYGVLSGVFNNVMEDNWGFMTTTLRRMFAVCNKGIAFNAMSHHVDYQDEGLFYTDPLQVLDFCKSTLGGHPILRHDYTVRPGGFPFEYAVYVYKSPRYFGP
jgi:hypothetical protein